MNVYFVVECVICRWQTNRFESSREQPYHDDVPMNVLRYFARHIKSKHPEYSRFSVTEVYEKFGHKVRVRSG